MSNPTEPDSHKVYADGEPCNHPGCLSHVSHPCEGCGRIAGREPDSGRDERVEEIGNLLLEMISLSDKIADPRTRLRYVEIAHATNELSAEELNERDARLTALEQENERIKTEAGKQAEDEGLWFQATRAPEQYLQDALRRIHAVIEGDERQLEALGILPTSEATENICAACGEVEVKNRGGICTVCATSKVPDGDPRTKSADFIDYSGPITEQGEGDSEPRMVP